MGIARGARAAADEGVYDRRGGGEGRARVLYYVMSRGGTVMASGPTAAAKGCR